MPPSRALLSPGLPARRPLFLLLALWLALAGAVPSGLAGAPAAQATAGAAPVGAHSADRDENRNAASAVQASTTLAPGAGLYLTLGAAPNTVYRLEPAGTLTPFYTRAQGPLTHFAFDAQGQLYYSDANGMAIYRVGVQGGEEVVWQAQTYVRDIGFDAQGRLCFSHSSGTGGDGQVWCISAAGGPQLLATVPLNEVGGYWGGNFAFDGAGTLYVSSGNTAPAAIYKLVPGQQAQPVFTSSDEIVGFEMRDGTGAIYLSDRTQALRRVPPGGGPPALVYRIPAGQVAPDVKLAGSAGPVPRRFQGVFLYTPGRIMPGAAAQTAAPGGQDAPQVSVPQAGVPVNLMGYPAVGGPAQLLDTEMTLADGSYDVGTLLDGFDHFEVQKGTTRGLLPGTASGPAGALVLDPATVRFPGSTLGVACCADFSLRDPVARLPNLGPKYLIVTRAAVVPALADFIAYKQFQGLNVIVKTVEDLDATGTGANRREKIRNYEKSLLGGFNGLKYVLLIGTDTTIPYLQLSAFGLDASRDPAKNAAACGFTPTTPNTCGWPSDWYYVDLNSNWDSNGDGVIGEQFWPDPGTSKRDQPPAFHPDVSLGRIQMDNPATVQTALAASINFERDSGAWKGQALLAGAMMDYPGKHWDPPGNAVTGTYQIDPYKTDQGVLMERVWNDILNPQGFTRTRLYEQFSPTGTPPSPYPVDAPLTDAQLVSAWTGEEHGLVKVAGHGAAGGVVRRVWANDYNGNGVVENPLAPPDNRWELQDWWYIDTAQWLTSPNGKAPILMVMACDTGDALHPNNLPTTLMARGQIAGWTGGSATVGYITGWTGPADGWAQTMDYNITDALIRRQMPLGQAVWTGLSEYAATGRHDWGLLNWDLYGDPALNYWGDGPDLTTPWPMFHRDWPGTGLAYTDGPGTPMVAWSKATTGAPAGLAAPSPVAGSSSVIIGDGSGVVRAYSPSGAPLWSYHTGGPIDNAAALARDGTTYVKSTDGYLYALDAAGGLKWKRLAGDGDGSPKLASDGTIYVGGSQGSGASKRYYLYAYRPNGGLAGSAQVDGRVTTAVSIATDGSVWAGTANGMLYHFAYNLATASGFPIDPGFPIGNGLALANDSAGSVFVPSGNNRLVAFGSTTGTIRWSFAVTDSLRAAPALDPDGRVFFGTHSGEFYSVSGSDGTELWHVHVGGAADSAPAIDSGSAYFIAGESPAQLYALRLSDGAVRWKQEAGGSSGGASAPAIGDSAYIYLANTEGTMIAISQWHWLKPPIILYTKPRPGDIVIDIDPGDPASWLQIERREPGGQWGLLGNLQPNPGGGIVSFMDGSVRPGQRYEYRALANAGPAAPVTTAAGPAADPSDYSAPAAAQALPQAPAVPGAPVVTALSATSLKVSWLPVDSTAVTVTLFRQDPGGGPFSPIAVLAAGTTETADAGLEPGSQYWYALQAANPGGSLSMGPAGSGTTFTQNLPAPSNVDVADTGGGFEVCWQPGQAGLPSVVARLADGETEPKIIATAPAGENCVTDGSIFPSAFRYLVKHVSGGSESPWAWSGRHEAPDFGPRRSMVYLPLLQR